MPIVCNKLRLGFTQLLFRLNFTYFAILIKIIYNKNKTKNNSEKSTLQAK